MHAAVGGAQTQASIDGSIGEIIFFQRIVSSAEREMVEGYLAHKWGIASNLPVTHPYYSAPP